MNDLSRLLREHAHSHPHMEPQDAVKFLYQSILGPGHLIADEATALTRLQAEWDSTPTMAEEPLTEPLGCSYIRLNISACKAIGLSTKTVAKLFYLSANEPSGQQKTLDEAFALLYDLPFPREDIDRYLMQYRAAGMPAVSHSASYRAHYRPAYRVIARRFEPLLPVLAAIDRQLAQDGNVRVAMDGPCASGKSTLGEQLQRIYGCPLIHMDDFFLRPEQRSPQRLEQPGGNVDYERFAHEVLMPLTQNQTVRYRPWQCGTGSFGLEIVLAPAPLALVEGSYSLRPDLREGYTLRIWVEAPWDVREQRLLARGGSDCLQRFCDLWIPLEDHYFHTCAVKDCCHLTYYGC